MSDKKKLILSLFFLIIFAAHLSLCTVVYADNNNGKKIQYSHNTGVVLANDKGEILHAKNREKLFVPASILKILTSLAAIHILGENHHFSTDYYFDRQSKNLYIKGFGDPLFISEMIEQMCREIIFKTEIKQINNIILDQTFFSSNIKIPGKGDSLNPYDAMVGALCANFNTITFKFDSKKKRFISGEPQTPLLPIFYNDIKNTGLKQGRIILSRQQSFLYPGLLIKYFFGQHNIKITGSVLTGRFDTRGGKAFSFQSEFKTIDLVQKLLKFSNNFIANQLMLVMGAKIFGTPATLEKGVKALKLFSRQNLDLENIKIHEGSGLSRKNLISPSQMLTILLKFMPYHSLLKRNNNDYYKTGTLLDVRTRAGYILGGDNRLYPYVIMVNEKNQGYELILQNLINMVRD